MRIKLSLRGKEYVADAAALANVTIGEVRTIKRETGLTLTGLGDRLPTLTDDDDPDLYATLVFLLMSRSGEPVTWADVERIPLADLAAGFSVVPDEPPPTPPAEPPAEAPLGELAVVHG